MDKRGVCYRVVDGVFFLFFIISIFALLYITLASQPFVTTSEGLIVFNINEDVSVPLNVSINNTHDGVVGNITQINITITNPGLASAPAGFSFTANTNGTSGRTLGTGAGNHSFVNTSNVLSWTNTSYFVVNGSNGSFVEFFFFNATFTTPGNYTMQVLSMNASGGVNQTNLTVQVNDTTFPLITMQNSTQGVFDNSSNLSVNAIFINVTITENNISNVTFRLHNATAVVNLTNFSDTTVRTLNITGLADGNYTYNVTTADLANNRNSSETRNVLIDTTFPISVNFGNSTQNVFDNSSNVSAGAIFMNFTFTEINVRNVTFRLHNATASVNVTTFDGRGTTTLNVTGLADGNYTYNITVTDIVNNVNSSATRTVVLDTTIPLLSLGNETHNVKINDTNVSANAIFINLTSVTEINIRNVTFRLHNATASVNVTIFTGGGTTSLNITGLADGNYSYNATICDIAHNCNVTATQTARLDNQAPSTPSLSCTPTNVRQNDVITCTCSGGADATVGINRSSGTNGYSFTINPSTGFTGVFTTSCSIKDLVGLASSSSVSYTVSHALTGSSGGSGGGASAGATYVVREEQSVAGFTKEMSVSDRFKVTTSDNTPHTVTVSQITSDNKIKITIQSEPIEVLLGIGETKRVDVNNDRIYDISVTLHSINNGQAKVTVKTIHELIPQEETGAVSEPITEEIKEEISEVVEEKKSRALIWIVGIVVLAIIIFVVVLRKRK